jgi:hypothetical protein
MRNCQEHELGRLFPARICDGQQNVCASCSQFTLKLARLGVLRKGEMEWGIGNQDHWLVVRIMCMTKGTRGRERDR